jgi:cytochrome oxidase Cu insertion factor (SCO1/SenC/PrrC family)
MMQSDSQVSQTPRSASTRWIVAIMVLGMIVAAGYLILNRESSFDPSKAAIDGLPGTVGVARVAPDIPARTVDGRAIRLSELKGKVIILNFWATW